MTAGGWSGPLPAGLGAALTAAGLEQVKRAGRLPHPTGRLVAYGRSAPAHAVVPAPGVLVCGIVGLPGFHAPALARLWGAAAGAALASAEVAAGTVPSGGWSTAALAAHLERDPRPLADALAVAVRETAATGVILPALLGRERSEEVRRVLVDAAGVPVGEALGVPPSLPGWRLDRALDAALRAADVEVVPGRVVDRTVARRRVTGVLVVPAGAGGNEPFRIEARTFVLATGKFLAGGIRADDAFEEPALGCPVWVEHLAGVFDAPERLTLTHPDRRATQSLLRAGVATDPDRRPVDRRGVVVHENVVVAGSVRSDVDPSTLGLGHAAEDGWRAGLGVEARL